MAELFGFRIERSKGEGAAEPSFIAPTPDDGTIDVAGGGFFGQVLDTDGRERTDIDLIRRYREISLHPECDMAVEDIVNEAVVANELKEPVRVNTEFLPYGKDIRRKIEEEAGGWGHVLNKFDMF